MRISSIAPPTIDGPVITWASFTGAQYAVYGSTNFVRGYDVLLQDAIPATPPLNTFTNTADGMELRGYAMEHPLDRYRRLPEMLFGAEGVPVVPTE